jgi:hypothetical protein
MYYKFKKLLVITTFFGGSVTTSVALLAGCLERLVEFLALTEPLDEELTLSASSLFSSLRLVGIFILLFC